MPSSSSPSAPETAPLSAALVAQLGGIVVVTLLVLLLGRLTRTDLTQIPFILALLQGGIAAAISLKQPVPLWWLPIHLGFLPLAVLVRGLDIAPGWFLGGFVLLLLVFWRTDKSRVPLYLSSRQTAVALAALLPKTPSRVLDIGCGDAGLLRRLALARPDCQFTGIEHAPLTCLAARLRTLGLPNVRIRWGSFWDEPFGSYDLVYAFLSPAPMARLWRKVTEEMAENTMLVSNSFAIPSVAADHVIAVADRRATRLYLYHPDKANDSAAIPAILSAPDKE